MHYAAVRNGVAESVAKIGFSGNLSLQGMMIRAPRVHPPGTVLRIDLLFSQQRLRLTGRVIWAREGPVQWLATGKIGMGVKFTDPPSELAELIRGAASAPQAGRADQQS